MFTEKSNPNEPVRIAHVVGKHNSINGVIMVINNYYRHIDHTKYQFDYIIDADSDLEPRQELIEMGARYYVVPPYQNIFAHMKELIRLFRRNHYKIVHSSMNTLSVFSLCAAWIAGVPVRINHNHSTAAPGDTKRNLMKYALRPFAKVFATHLCACSRYAGEWLFGKRMVEQGKVTVFNNAIDTKKFSFDPKVRNEVRKELGVEDKFVIGHVGRLCFQKNQEFLIDLLPMIREQNPNAVLLLVGIGETMDMIREKARQKGLEEAVIFTGARDDVGRLYQAMDIFVLPSRYEGLGMVAVEAQCAGLSVLASDAVPTEAKASEKIRYLSLADPQKWIKSLSAVNQDDRKIDIDPKFDILIEVEKMNLFYDCAIKDKITKTVKIYE